MSFYENKRTDEYGGCFMNRMRLLKEVYEEVRANVGTDYPIMVRFSADEHVVGGRDLSESRMIVKLMEEWGVDAINCSNGVYGTYNPGQVAPMYMPHAWTIHNAAEVKKLVNIPVIGVNRITDPLMADNLLSIGMCDFVGMSRASLADPALPNKAKAGDWEGIRTCIGCLQGCVGALYFGDPFRCLVNPEMGNEYKYTYEALPEKKQVMVIGGGVAGMEAAIAAARRGHTVSLYEKSDRLGGQFLPAAFPPGKGEFTTFISWLKNEMLRLGVTVFLNTEATAALVKSKNPDKVILASGGVPLKPPIPGIDRKNVVTAERVLLGKDIVEGRIVIAGGGAVGLETAIHLAYSERGAITVVEMLDEIDKTGDGVIKVHLMKLAAERGIQFRTSTKVIEVCENGVVLEQSGHPELFYCDFVVLAVGYRANDSLRSELSFLGDKLAVVGDAEACANALTASHSGFAAGYYAYNYLAINKKQGFRAAL
jgi:NADPH-dependent 2,4-dienoyl-CoA reductase/sulfur reductase-like enzyme